MHANIENRQRANNGCDAELPAFENVNLMDVGLERVEDLPNATALALVQALAEADMAAVLGIHIASVEEGVERLLECLTLGFTPPCHSAGLARPESVAYAAVAPCPSPDPCASVYQRNSGSCTSELSSGSRPHYPLPKAPVARSARCNIASMVCARVCSIDQNWAGSS